MHSRTLRDLSKRPEPFGSLRVLRRAVGRYTRPHWLCACVCGVQTVVRGDNLIAGRTLSCGHCDAGKRRVQSFTPIITL